MAKDILAVAQVYLVMLVLQLLIWPWMYKNLAKFADRGWAAGRVVLTLAVASIIWWLGFLKVPVNTLAGVLATTTAVLAIALWSARKEIKRAYTFNEIRRGLILFEELLFLSGLIIFAWIRAHQPDILGLEKFMDFGFINSYLHSPTLPAPDMWLAGKGINYYSFGHFWASVLIRLWMVIPPIGYNLMLAFIFGSGLAIAFSVVINLSEKFSYKLLIGGVVGALMVVVTGNSHTISSLLTKGSLDGYWYADATRFIHNSIHEFPSYSFVVSDLHAHLLGLPIVLTFLLFAVYWITTKRKWWLDLALGWLLGMMAMANSWDIANYSLLIIVVFSLKIVMEEHEDYGLLLSLPMIFIAAILTALLWYRDFSSMTSGIGIVTERSPLWQLAYLWTGHLVLSLLAVILNLKKKKKNLLVFALAITAALLIIIPELIYAKDIYPTHPRANTMFKLTFQAFVMMSILGGWVLNQGLMIRPKKALGRVIKTLLVVLVLLIGGGLALFPVEAYKSYYVDFLEYRGINGTAYLSTMDPNEVEIIDYLNKHRDGRNLVEAVGDSFTEYNAISSYTGIPTIIGWRAHEWLWRGSYDEVGNRDGEVTQIYGNLDPTVTMQLLKKYNVGWIVITKREKDRYAVDINGLLKYGKSVWEKDGDLLIQIKSQ